MSDLPRCESKNPATGNPCCMAQGHDGAHRTGGVEQRDIIERWVTRCPEGECILQEHEVGIHAGMKVCLHCGFSIEAPMISTEQALEYSAIREEAWKAMAAELRRERNYHANQARDYKAKYLDETKDLLRQVEARDKLIDTVLENLGMEQSERFLLDRHSKEIAYRQEILVEDRKECRKAWKDVQQGILDWMQRHNVLQMDKEFGEKLWRAAGVLNRILDPMYKGLNDRVRQLRECGVARG